MWSKVSPFVCAIIVLAPNFAIAHSRAQETGSLANVAREQRLKNNEVKQPARVFTNDDLPASPPESSTPFLAINLPSGTVDGKSQRVTGSNAANSEPHDEKYFRDRMNQLQANLESDKGELVTLQGEMAEHLRDISAGSEGIFYHPTMWTDPVGAGKYWFAEDERLRGGISALNGKIAADEKDISDFIDQCRRESCEPGWIR
jgi:hypothetical protein